MTEGTAVLHLELPSRVCSVPRARRAVTAWLEGSRTATEDDRWALRLAVTEVVANAVEHGGEGPVTVTLAGRDGPVVVVVGDRGRWPVAGRTGCRNGPSVTSERGRGLVLVRDAVDTTEVVAVPRGTAVVLVRHLGATARAAVPSADR